MIYGIGADIAEVARIKDAIDKYGDKFLKRIFTETEIEYCEAYKDTKYLHYAARFAAKESMSKAIGTGITQGFKFKEFGVKNEENGKPSADLSGAALEKYGNMKFHISLSHTEANAIAYVILETL
jgi:holo-[acyl-carrier protein] synthase